MAQSKGKAKQPAKPRTPRKAKAAPGSRGLAPEETALTDGGPLLGELAGMGAKVLARYRDPLGGTPLTLAVAPLERVEPTPFQRDLSPTHVEKLVGVLGKIGRFLDPIIAVVEDGKLWTPNGSHRLAAMKKLGAKAITALVVEDQQVAYQILALNTEKAHNLRERCLEVVRMYRDLATRQPQRPENEFALEFEDASYATLGICYEQRPRLAGGAYHPLVRRVDALLPDPLPEALALREERARALLALDDQVTALVDRLRERGLQSPYLRAFVMARINPLRFARGKTEMTFDEAVAKARASADKFDAAKVKPTDLASTGGAPDEAT